MAVLSVVEIRQAVNDARMMLDSDLVLEVMEHGLLTGLLSAVGLTIVKKPRWLTSNRH